MGQVWWFCSLGAVVIVIGYRWCGFYYYLEVLVGVVFHSELVIGWFTVYGLVALCSPYSYSYYILLTVLSCSSWCLGLLLVLTGRYTFVVWGARYVRVRLLC